ncbi:fumarylacetoacetate hydrolase family protein [Nocardioides sp.]|uniref:fumarylacetoacetate hydrolase family protein n=1 Tax=Nocardioides sp. TaxID=35761 RepID=UPI00262A62A9|nr:fumarylacetoacetate hydrolase family protein [Nocardioides sp.]
MRIANLDGRAVLVLDDEKGADIATASAGTFGPDLQGIYDRWDEFVAWAGSADAASLTADVTIDRDQLGSPSPKPSQIVAIGLNYVEHAEETGLAIPTDLPPVFTKFSSSLTGPTGEIDLPPGGNTDWEVEVVAVISKPAHKISAEDAWDYVAGLSVGQDISERALQFRVAPPQFGFAKSYPKFAPIGPWLVTLDELEANGFDKDNLALGCSIDGETVQDGHTSKLIFSIPATIAKLAEVITLQPGDVIFTGTPDGVGFGMEPPRYLKSGETLRTWVEGLGELEHTFR